MNRLILLSMFVATSAFGASVNWTNYPMTTNPAATDTLLIGTATTNKQWRVSNMLAMTRTNILGQSNNFTGPVTIGTNSGATIDQSGNVTITNSVNGNVVINLANTSLGASNATLFRNGPFSGATAYLDSVITGPNYAVYPTTLITSNMSILVAGGNATPRGGFMFGTEFDEDLIIITGGNQINNERMRINGSTGAITVKNPANARIDLQSAASTGAAFTSFYNQAGSGYVGIDNASGNAFGYVGALPNALVIDQYGAYPIQFATQNTNRMTISATGDVTLSGTLITTNSTGTNMLLGTNYIGGTAGSPTMATIESKVGINTETPGTSLQLGGANPGWNTENGIWLVDNSKMSAFRAGQDSTHSFVFAWTYNTNLANASADFATYGYSNPLNMDASRITLQGHGGNVGIGTTSPTNATLEVNGNVYASNATGTNTLLGTNYIGGTVGSPSMQIDASQVKVTPTLILGATGKTKITDNLITFNSGSGTIASEYSIVFGCGGVGNTQLILSYSENKFGPQTSGAIDLGGPSGGITKEWGSLYLKNDAIISGSVTATKGVQIPSGTLSIVSTNVTFDLSTNYSKTLGLIMTTNCYLVQPLNLVAGQQFMIDLRQDAVGGWKLDFNTNYWKFPSGVILTTTTNANSWNMLSCVVGQFGTNVAVVQSLNFQ